ncbi:condensation domain-containing protein [Streptomyces sp. NPDC001984]
MQRERLAGALARPDHHVEQLVWRWYGPLDATRFDAAWQAVGACESVLRTAFVWDPRPRAVVHEHGGPEVVRHGCGTAARRALLRARERARGFDLRRPGLLRVALLDGPEPCTDVLVTYHRALLDSWSVRLLMRECCRAYLVGGLLPGCERRPDLGDCAGWASRTSGRPATSGDGLSPSIRIRPRRMAPGSTTRPAGTTRPGQAEGQGRRHGSPRRVCQAGGQPNQFTVLFSEV